MHLQGNIPQRASFQIPCKFVPQSLSVVDMLKLGKLITDTTTSAEIFNVDMSVMARTGRPTTVDFSIEPEPFGIGGFRKAFKATSNDRGFNGSTWVVKRYLEKAAVDIIASHRRVGRGGREGRKFQLSMIIGFFFCMLPSASYNFNSFFGGWRNFFLVMLLLFLAPKQLAAYAPT